MALFNYECDEVKRKIDEVSPNYPQLITFEKEWLFFHKYHYIPGIPVELEYEAVSVNPKASVFNAIPFQYKSAILKGNTKYRDIDTGDILDTFDETKNLELVSVKMPVLTTTGKNLLPCKTIYNNSSFSGLTINTENNRVRVSGTATGICDIEFFNINVMSDDEYIKVKPNTKYILSATLHSGSISGNLNLACKSITDDGTIRWLGSTFTTNSNESKVNRIRIAVPLGFVFNDAVISLQLEESTVATSYEPYKSNILTVNEPVELRGIGEVKDELNLLTGELTERIGEITFDGSDDVNWWYAGESDTIIRCNTTINIKWKTQILCNNLPTDISNLGTAPYQYEGIANHVENYIYLYLKKEKIENYNNDLTNIDKIEVVKDWLSKNPIIIHYQLATESIKTVDLPPLNNPYEGTNNYELTSNIPCEVVLEVPVVSTGKQTLEEINNQ